MSSKYFFRVDRRIGITTLAPSMRMLSQRYAANGTSLIVLGYPFISPLLKSKIIHDISTVGLYDERSGQLVDLITWLLTSFV